MDVAQLRELQAPLKARYRDEPASRGGHLRAKGEIGQDGLACRVETGRALVEAGLHPATGGSGLQACSGDMLLEALAACAGRHAVGGRDGAGDRGPQAARSSAEGDLDFRGTLGVEQGRAGRLPRDPAALHARHRRRRGAAGDAAEADRALLRRAADPAHAGREHRHDHAGSLTAGQASSGPRAGPGRLRLCSSTKTWA